MNPTLTSASALLGLVVLVGCSSVPKLSPPSRLKHLISKTENGKYLLDFASHGHDLPVDRDVYLREMETFVARHCGPHVSYAHMLIGDNSHIQLLLNPAYLTQDGLVQLRASVHELNSAMLGQVLCREDAAAGWIKIGDKIEIVQLRGYTRPDVIKTAHGEFTVSMLLTGREPPWYPVFYVKGEVSLDGGRDLVSVLVPDGAAPQASLVLRGDFLFGFNRGPLLDPFHGFRFPATVLNTSPTRASTSMTFTRYKGREISSLQTDEDLISEQRRTEHDRMLLILKDQRMAEPVRKR